MLDLEVWSLHSEGMSFREIGRLLNIKSTSSGKKSVKTIISRLSILMRSTPIEVDGENENE